MEFMQMNTQDFSFLINIKSKLQEARLPPLYIIRRQIQILRENILASTPRASVFSNMEVLLQKPSAPKEERRAEFHEDSAEIRKLGRESRRSPSPNNKDPIIKKQVCNGFQNATSSSFAKDPAKMSQEEQLESTKAEMGVVREENERLKMSLAQIAKDYQSLQMQLFDVIQQEKLAMNTTVNDEEEPALVSLSLGTSSTSSPHKKGEKITNDINKAKGHEKNFGEGLTLGLEFCKFQGSRNDSLNESASNHSGQDGSFEEQPKEEDPSKILKNPRNGDEDDVSHQPQVKKARVSVRARCESLTMNDGCQWRKYGQKISKGNPCPRAYFRCTVGQSCPVRKQVQRCSEDMSILITTYEGTHNHPLPISATAMASATSAAASMLLTGSSHSPPGAASSTAATTLASCNYNPLRSFNFSLSADHSSTCRSRPFLILPNPSYPTITLDLTAPAPPSTSFSGAAFPANQYFSNLAGSDFAPAMPSSSWSSGSYLNYKSSVLSSIYQSYLQKNTTKPSATPPPLPSGSGGGHHSNISLTDTIAKAITSDPSFQSAIAAAITSSYVGSAHGSHDESGGDHHGHGRLQSLGDRLNSAVPAAASNGNACATSIMNRSPAGRNSNSGHQQGSLAFLQPSLGSASSPVDLSRENN